MLADFFNHDFFNVGMFRPFVGDNDTLFFIICGIVLTIIPYLLGSINFAIIISGRRFHDDVREHGSGNAGMTNMLRTYGKRAAGLTLLGDALKAVLAAIVGYYMMGMYGAYIAGFFCVLGHTFPIFHKFKGGKGVVTTAASMLMCNPIVFLIILALFVTIVAIWRFISLGSIMCALLYPFILSGVDMVLLGHPSGLYIIFALLTSVLVIVKHKDNIKRLLEGKENKLSFKKQS
ncbi:MAG: glycerol-3-phosphate 1-O-acyltransferase PlsY [Clostridia bacterium]|nr:glycerol-3-phosphate 1-O-acyltransferase PlsY [Clostridia bacterium]